MSLLLLFAGTVSVTPPPVVVATGGGGPDEREVDQHLAAKRAHGQAMYPPSRVVIHAVEVKAEPTEPALAETPRDETPALPGVGIDVVAKARATGRAQADGAIERARREAAAKVRAAIQEQEEREIAVVLAAVIALDDDD